MHDPKKGYPALRRGRWSVENATYFLTICAMRPCGALVQPLILDAIKAQNRGLEARKSRIAHCAVVMPDHLHFLVTLTGGESLEECVRSFKGPLTPRLRAAGVHWQPSFYDRRLRADDDLLAVFRYVFLNPHRARLAANAESWPGYYCRAEDWGWFGPLIGEAGPEPDWLRD